jgi:hypothetical protein
MSQFKNNNVVPYAIPSMLTCGAFFDPEGNKIQFASLLGRLSRATGRGRCQKTGRRQPSAVLCW